jgi:GNAT superfamily N-acetyltransferase
MDAVRLATPEDAPRFTELEAELRAAVLAQRGGVMALDAVPSPLDRLLSDPEQLVVMGTVDSVVAGYARGHLEGLEAEGRRGVLDACYVEPGARGAGLGRILLDEVAGWFRRQGCLGMDGVALPGDRGSKSFFEAAGFKARLITMHRGFD